MMMSCVRSWGVLLWCMVLMVVEVMSGAPREDESLYNLGVGIYDVTGPAAGVNMMGYANPAQVNAGIHLRLFSRAFIIDDGTTRIVFVSVDIGMMGQAVKTGVVDKLGGLYGDTYTEANVILSGTHTHSGPAGYLQYMLFDITSWGFIHETYNAIVEGILQSIVRAHNSVAPGRLYLSSGELLDTSVNRSPTAYRANPSSERAKYDHNTDKTLTLLKFVAQDGTDLGLVNWFAVHPTSMNNTNKLVSGDNKGYASQLFEKVMNPGALPGEGKFVAAFAQSNCGDVSPNTDGPRCQDTGQRCDMQASTCGGRVQKCYAAGPGKDMEESTEIIGTNQFRKAHELYFGPNNIPVSGPVQVARQNVDMTNYSFTSPNGTQARTCVPALGFSFAAGTTDGPGAFDFTQGMTEGNPFWNMIVNFIQETSPEQIACHEPKPILLDTGHYNIPYAWHPTVVETQVARVGQLVVAAVPGELTTMAGRRLRDHIAATLAAEGIPPTVPVVAGLSNGYTHYITTIEEYAVQRYEGASTIFGPHTHGAYMHQYGKLVAAMVRNEDVPPGPDAPNLLEEQISLLPPVVFDGVPLGYSFGDVLTQPDDFIYVGETVLATFVAGHPRNNVMAGKSFLTVEQLDADGRWTVIATDASWETKFEWDRISTLLGTSVATVRWHVPEEANDGTYRITHSGYFKTWFRGIEHYAGVTQTFVVGPKPDLSEVNSLDERRDNVTKKSWWNMIFG